MTNIAYSDAKDFYIWATDFSKRYPDVLQHWMNYGDPLKKGLAMLVLENEAVTSSTDDQIDRRVQA